MDDNILFSESFEIDGKEHTITATTDDSTETIIKKALDIEYRGSIKVYQTTPPESYEDLPDTYIQTYYMDTAFEYANDQIISEKDEYRIYIITRHEKELEKLCKRVCKTLKKRGFCIIESGISIDSSDGDGYYGKGISVTFYR